MGDGTEAGMSEEERVREVWERGRGEEEEVERLVAERIEVRGVRRLVFDEPTVERLYLKQAPR